MSDTHMHTCTHPHAHTHAHHFRVSSIDNDTHAIRRGGHLTGWAWGGSRAWWSEAGPGEGVQGEGIDIIVVDKIPEGGGAEIKYLKITQTLLFGKQVIYWSQNLAHNFLHLATFIFTHIQSTDTHTLLGLSKLTKVLYFWSTCTTFEYFQCPVL